jgi:hypothetical protein
MRMMPTLAAAVALGLSLLILGGLGLSFGGDIGDSDGQQDLQDELGETSENGTPELEPEQGNDGGGFFSFAVGALSEMRSIVSIILFLPGALEDLGLPSEAAAAMGRAIQLVIAIGLIQVALQFDIR